jgi:Protein of unknown function (DUF2889)
MTEVLADPLVSVPALKPGTLRRTMHVDIGPPAAWGTPGHQLILDGAARDIRVERAGVSPTVLREAGVNARFDSARVLLSLDVTPESPWTEAMIGQRVGSGFRRSLDQVAPIGPEASLVRQLMEDLPAAALISGYSSLRIARRLGENPADLTPPGVLIHMTDICSGWRADGSATVSIAAGHGVPVQECPPAPDLTVGDADSWHHIPRLADDWMRRKRLVDVTFDESGQTAAIWAMFRDTVGDPDTAAEVVLHEYAVSGVLSMTPDGLLLESVVADPRVLPMFECPLAAPEVHALSGTLLADLSKAVPTVLFSVKSCTHLNDLLRNVGGMSPVLPGPPAT